MMNPNTILLSVPTVGEVPAATHAFLTRGYKPPRQGRSVAMDVVHNQNGIFKYVFDNGPNIYGWDPFELVFDDAFVNLLGSATVQFANLLSLWERVGPKGMRAPEGVYSVHFGDFPLERRFLKFPARVGDKIEFAVTVQIEEG